MRRALGKGRRLPPDVVAKNAAERAARAAAEPPNPPTMNL